MSNKSKKNVIEMGRSALLGWIEPAPRSRSGVFATTVVLDGCGTDTPDLYKLRRFNDYGCRFRIMVTPRVLLVHGQGRWQKETQEKE